MVDNVCLNAVRGISDLVIAPGLINVDFADVRTIMTGMGRALMGTGRGRGDKRAVEAAQQAISSPLLEDVSINGATGILLNITGGPDLTLAEMNEACSLIAEAADPEANIIFGSVIDAHAGDEVRITVIATGFQPRAQDQLAPPGSRGGHRGREGQMALPMSPSMSMSMPMSMPANPTPRGGYAAAPGPRPQEPMGENINVDDFYVGLDQFPPAAVASAPPPPVAEWTPAERPIIRPPVSGLTQAMPPPQRRQPTQVGAPRPADDLGVEESEFDKPTYLRRGLFAPE
jgi:hypothetical protein